MRRLLRRQPVPSQRLRFAAMRSCSTATSNQQRIGFIGLGNMGSPMAMNLVKAGHRVTVFDLHDAAVDALVAKGAHAATSPAALAKDSSVVVTMLPSSPHVHDVYLGSGDVVSNLAPGSVCIDASTIDPSTARSVSAAAAAAGLLAVDAPVSGGVPGAQAGTLTFMVGGPKAAYERALPLLQAMGANIVHCGDAGNGQVVKICNNLVLGITMAGVSEAMNLGMQLGMDAKVLAGIFNTSSARCWSSDTYNPVPGVMDNVPAARNYEGGFGVDLMAKDVGLAVAAGNDIKAPLPLGGVALQLYNLASRKGYGTKDFGSIFDFIQSKKE